MAYKVLGVPGELPGLFDQFDPTRYHGSRSLEVHFTNLFATRLRDRVNEALRRQRSDKGRRGDPSFRGLRRSSQETEDRDFAEEVERLSPTVRDAVDTCLSPTEREVIDLQYWKKTPSRLVAAILRMNRRTAKKHHDSALRKLRRHYGLAG